jgi:hypothetical protein
MVNLFNHEIQDVAAGVIICDIINNQPIVFLGKSNVLKRYEEYEGFGGKYDKGDISTLHTALRETIEEFFNILVPTEFINKLAIDFIKHDLIIKRIKFYGMSYLINLKALHYIFYKLTTITDQLDKYKINNTKTFNYNLYLQERIIDDIPDKGLNEIRSIHIVSLKDILKNKSNLQIRWFTNKIIHQFFK